MIKITKDEARIKELKTELRALQIKEVRTKDENNRMRQIPASINFVQQAIDIAMAEEKGEYKNCAIDKMFN